MAGISYKIDASDVIEGMRDLKRRLTNAGGFYKNVGDYMVGSTLDNFGRETAPDGVPWKPLLPSTICKRVSKGRSPSGILRMYGNLAGSISAQSNGQEARIGSGLEYAAIHQLGGTIKKPERQAVLHLKRNAKTGEIGSRFVKKSKSNVVQDVTIPAHEVTIPARPYLGVSEDDENRIIEIARDWLHN